MVADGADFGSLGSDDYVAAVGALPDYVAVAGEDQAVFDVGEEFAIALFVFFLDGADHFEMFGNLNEAFFAGLFGHAGVHVGPFEVLAVSGVFQIDRRVGNFAVVQVFEPYLGVFLLIVGGFFKDLGNLDVAVLLGLGGVIRVLVAGHGLPGEGFEEVLFCFGSFEVHIVNF